MTELPPEFFSSIAKDQGWIFINVDDLSPHSKAQEMSAIYQMLVKLMTVKTLGREQEAAKFIIKLCKTVENFERTY